jgi:hypothetical protein
MNQDFQAFLVVGEILLQWETLEKAPTPREKSETSFELSA